MRLIAVKLIFLLAISMGYAQTDSLFQALENSNDSGKAVIYNELSVNYQNAGWDSSLIMAGHALKLAKKFELTKQRCRAYNLMGKAMYYRGQYDTAELYLDSASTISKDRYPSIYIEILLNNGMLKEHHGLFPRALELYQRAYKIAEKLDSDKDKAKTLNNMGIVHKEMGNYQKSLSFFNEALAIKEKQNDKAAQAFIVNNIGTIYDLQGKTEQALDFYKQAMKLNRQMGNTFAVAYIKHNTAIILKKTGQYKIAEEYFRQSLQVAKKLDDYLSMAYNYHHIADLELRKTNLDKALEFNRKSMRIAAEHELSKVMSQNYHLLSKIYKAKGKQSKAFKYYQKYAELKDSIFSKESRKRIEKLQTAYEKDRMEKKVALLEKEKKLNELKLEKSRVKIANRNLWLAIILGGLVLILIFAILLYRQVQQKKIANQLLRQRNKEINQQNEEIKVQRDHLSGLNNKLEAQKAEIEAQNDALAEQRNMATAQRDKIFEQKKWITDNITYAGRIQNALLPPEEIFRNQLSDYFIFNRPQGIVGGDFYWINAVNGQLIIAAADCTGHGVTGGFMSILGISLLNDIIMRKKITEPGTILNETRRQLINLLHQTGKDHESKDGMDISLLMLNKQTKTFKFAAANQKAYIVNIQNSQLEELQGDKMPVSIYLDIKKDFTTMEGQYTDNDIFYLFSDGYPDQFGGNQNRKYLYHNFKKLIRNTATLPLQQQLDKITTEFYTWKGDQEQVDDVIILGIKP